MQRIQVVKIQMLREKNMMVENKNISSPKDVAEIMFDYLQYADREHLVVITLNTKNDINSISTVSIGSLQSSIAHSREIFKTAILSNAASIIFCHNHPSGDPSFSKDDILISKRIKECGDILGIKVLDHIVITDTKKFLSMKSENIVF
ncbi:JAB domain-containing protein [Bacteroides fragilis]|uniref:JAB domain-containing protein n=1 Tax=Bacteroides fragilis TaxID=817 RepID=UPI003219362D